MGALWTLKDAQAQFETLARAAEQGEPQRVTLDDGDEVVVMSKRHYDLMSRREKTFVEHLMDFPRLPEGMDDIFDDRHEYPSTPRDVDLGD